MMTMNRRDTLILVAGALVASSLRATEKTDNLSNRKALLERYYGAWQRKDLSAILSCLHDDILFKSPNATSHGKNAYSAATQRFLPLIESIEIRRRFVDAEGAMCALDFHCVAPIGSCPTAERLAFKDGLILEDELFFDARPFEAFARARAQESKT
jgi:hypothetical protein